MEVPVEVTRLNVAKKRINMNTLSSNRLELVSMGPAILEALLADDYAAAEQLGGFHIPHDLIIRQSTLQMRLHQMQAKPESQPWLLRAIVLRQTQTMCGRIGFHSEPGPEDLRQVAADGVEIGYAVGERFRRHGYAKEATITLMRWAYEKHQQRAFILSIAPDNVASLALAHSLGFNEIGSHIDEADGIELYFERRFKRWPVEWGEINQGDEGDLLTDERR
jgi:RimJ/RimL family protein N-acetyltransferase